MAGPWEDYAPTAKPAAKGPWDDYAPPTAAPTAAPAPQKSALERYSPLEPESTEKFNPDLLAAMTGPGSDAARQAYLQKTAPNLQNRLAGVGQRMYALGQGTGELGRDVLSTTDWGKKLSDALGLPTRADVDARKARDLPLTSSAAGKRGALAADLVTGSALAPVGGSAGLAGRLATGTGIGAGLGAVEPVGIKDSRTRNAITGGVAGLAGQGLGEAVGAGIGRAVGRTGPQIPLSEKQIAQRAMMDKGLTLDPSETNPSMLNKIMEGIAGKAPTSQLAMAKNEPVITNLVKQEFGIPADQRLNFQALETIRNKAGQAYADIKAIKQPMRQDKDFADVVKGLGNNSAVVNQSYPGLADNKGIEKLQQSLLKNTDTTFEGSVEAVKRLRRRAGANLKGYDDPDKLELGRAQLEAANGIENLMDRNLKALQMPDLLEAYRNARVTIAKTHDVEEVLDDDGLISTKLLKKRMDSGVPLSGNLAEIARAEGTQGRSLRNVKQTGGATLGDPLSMAVGLSGAHPATAVGLPFLRHGAQQAILSPAYQRAFVRPQATSPAVTDPRFANLIGRTAPQIPLGGQ